MDSTSIFCALFVLSFALLLWFFDHLAIVRRRNRVEAIILRILGH